jgi:hypothetical protein
VTVLQYFKSRAGKSACCGGGLLMRRHFRCKAVTAVQRNREVDQNQRLCQRVSMGSSVCERSIYCYGARSNMTQKDRALPFNRRVVSRHYLKVCFPNHLGTCCNAVASEIRVIYDDMGIRRGDRQRAVTPLAEYISRIMRSIQKRW